MIKKPEKHSISFTIHYNFPQDKAVLYLRSITKIEKFKVKFAFINEPDKLLTFNEIKKKYAKIAIEKGFDHAFYIVNEDTNQMEKIIFPTTEMWPPKAQYETHIEIQPTFLDISNQIKKIDI